LAVLAPRTPFSLPEDLRTLAYGLGCFPLVLGPSHPRTASRKGLAGIRSFLELGITIGNPHPLRALPPTSCFRGVTSIAFAENQLSPSLMSLSPLPTAHPRLLPQTWVRPSAARYGPLQPGHEEITWLRVRAVELDALKQVNLLLENSDSLALRLPLLGLACSTARVTGPLCKRYRGRRKTIVLFVTCETIS